MGKPKADPATIVINEEFIEIISKILAFFDGDIKKTRTWITIPNPAFGFIVPLRLMMMGKGNKVLQYIDAMAVENEPPEGFIVGSDGKLQKLTELREWTITYSNKNSEWYAAGEDSPEAKFEYEKVKVREIIVDSDPKTK